MAKAPAKKTAAAPAAKPAPAARKTPAATPPAAVVEEPEVHKEPTPVVAEQELTVFDLYLDVARAIDKTFVDPQHKETEQAFYKRLITTIANEPEGKTEPKLPLWDSLMNTPLGDIQPWYLAGVDQLEAGQPVAALSGYDSFKAAQAEKAKAQPTEKGAGLARYREKRAADKAAGIIPPKKEKAPKEPKGPRGDGSVGIVQKTVIAHPGMTLAQIKEQLVKDGHSINDGTVGVQYGNTRNIMRHAVAAGVTIKGFAIS